MTLQQITHLLHPLE